MKKAFLAVLTIFGIQNAHAVPVYMTFEGEISRFLNQDTENAANAAGYFLGTSLSYTFMYDTERAGYVVREDGTIKTDNDISTSYGLEVEYYYAEYVGGDSVLIDNYHPYADNYNSASNRTESNVPIRSSATVAEFINFAGWGKFWDDFKLGDTADITNGWEDNDPNTNIAYFTIDDAVLTYKGSENPYASVPEPTSFFLLGMGLVGLRIARRRL